MSKHYIDLSCGPIDSFGGKINIDGKPIKLNDEVTVEISHKLHSYEDDTRAPSAFDLFFDFKKDGETTFKTDTRIDLDNERATKAKIKEIAADELVELINENLVSNVPHTGGPSL